MVHPKRRKVEVAPPDLGPFQDFLNAVGASVVVLSPDRKVLYMNEQALRSWGEDGVGQDCFRALRNGREECADCPFDEILETHRQSNRPRPDPRAGKLVVRELPVRGARRVDDETPHVADIREVAEQLETVDEVAAGVDPAGVYEVVLVGNVTMVSLALGIDPEPLSMAPFTIASRRLPEAAAVDIGPGQVHEFVDAAHRHIMTARRPRRPDSTGVAAGSG